MVSNRDSKKDREAAVLEDVLSYCRVLGGYRRKQVDKLAGTVDSGCERPDLAIKREDGSVVGLEHFRVDHHVGKGKKAESKAAKLGNQLEKERKALCDAYGHDGDGRLLDDLASVLGESCALYMQNAHNACCDDLTLSLSKRLFDEKTGHAQRLSVYKSNLVSRYGKPDDASNAEPIPIEIGYLIELHTDFRGMFLTEKKSQARQLQVGECPLFEDAYDLLTRAARDVDWMLFAFYPSIGGDLVNAAIVDCRNGMFKTSSAKQGLSRTAYLGLGKSKPSQRQTKPGSAETAAIGDGYEISIEADLEELDPNSLWGTSFADAASALSLRKQGASFAATVSVQMLYEALLPEIKRVHGKVTKEKVLSLLGKMPSGEIITRMEAFGERYGFPAS